MTLLSVFTGAGGLDLGLEAAGFQIVGCIELDGNARKTITLNRQSWPLIEPDDILDMDLHSLPRVVGISRGKLALLAGGPPCQPFSKAAQWARRSNGMHDERSKCIKVFFELIRVFLPKVLLLENVAGFVRGPSSALPWIHSFLSTVNREAGTNYKLQWRVLNAVDYGVPQRRERAFLVASRHGHTFRWPDPTHSHSPITAWDAVHRIDGQKEIPVLKGKWASLLPSIPEGWNYQWHTEFGGGRRLFGYRTRYWSFLLKLDKAQPSWTIPATPGPATGPFHWDNRPLTIQEMLRLQSFPPTWRVWGDYRSQARQVGNATPPLLAEIIGRALANQFLGKRYRSDLHLIVRKGKKAPPPAPPAKVPAMYLLFEGPHGRHPGTGKGPKPITTSEELM